jgi:ketosteroid isomerase-like protein
MSNDDAGTAFISGTAVITELAKRFMAGDGAGAMALFAPDIRIEQPASLPHGGWHEGKDGMAAMSAVFGQYWTRVIEDPRIFGDDTRVVQVTAQTWTAKSTGKSATVDVAELFVVNGGLIREIRVFQQDTAALLATLE